MVQADYLDNPSFLFNNINEDELKIPNSPEITLTDEDNISLYDDEFEDVARFINTEEYTSSNSLDPPKLIRHNPTSHSTLNLAPIISVDIILRDIQVNPVPVRKLSERQDNLEQDTIVPNSSIIMVSNYYAKEA